MSAASQGKRRFARIDRLPPYVFNITAELKLAARRRGEDIIDMSMGNPDGATPPHIVAKLTEVAQRPDTHGYSASKGIPRLRRAISHWYKDRYAVDINPDTEAIVTIGSKEGLAHLMLATLDRGDTVLVPDPSYPIHIYGAVIAGAELLTRQPVGAHGLHRQAVAQQVVVRRGQGTVAFARAGCVAALAVAHDRGAVRLVQRGPLGDDVTERLVHGRRVVGEPAGGVADAPPAPVLQRLRQIPVVQRDEGLNSVVPQRLDQPPVEVEAALVGGAGPCGQDA